jgi:hypothetical protein
MSAIPGPTSICQLWKAIQLDEHLAVARGEVVALRTMYGRSLVKDGDRFEWTMRNLFPRLFQKAVYSGRRTKQAFIAFWYVPLQYWPKGSNGRLRRYFENAAKVGLLHLLGWVIWQLADLTPTRSTMALVPTAP